jgi:mannose-6-phosphate isomerase-like protein (cupin superfamily)
MEKVNISDKFQQIKDYWNPRIAGALNGQHVKLVKLKGEFIWHQHEQEDEMFFVVKGKLLIQFRDHEIHLETGEFIIIPRGVEHKPVAIEEVHIMLFEPATTLNTGDQQHELTRTSPDMI